MYLVRSFLTFTGCLIAKMRLPLSVQNFCPVTVYYTCDRLTPECRTSSDFCLPTPYPLALLFYFAQASLQAIFVWPFACRLLAL